MERQHRHRWDRRQWVGEGQGAARDHQPEAFAASWTYAQWVGEGQGAVRRDAQIQATGEGQCGLSGFGVADGVQYWAPTGDVAVAQRAAKVAA